MDFLSPIFTAIFLISFAIAVLSWFYGAFHIVLFAVHYWRKRVAASNGPIEPRSHLRKFAISICVFMASWVVCAIVSLDFG